VGTSSEGCQFRIDSRRPRRLRAAAPILAGRQMSGNVIRGMSVSNRLAPATTTAGCCSHSRGTANDGRGVSCRRLIPARRIDPGSESAAEVTIAITKPKRGSVRRCSVWSESRSRKTSLNVAVLIASNSSPGAR